MTYKEAIKTLKENVCAICAYGSQNMELCDIRDCDNRDAIKALEQEPCEDKRLYIRVFADYEPSVIAEKIYQICDEDKINEVAENLNGYLKQEPCDNCVSRAEVKSKAIKLWNGGGDEDYKFSTLVDYITDMPPVSPARPTRWIPVSERLPEDGEVILFSTKTDRVFEGRYFDDNTNQQWYSFRDETFAWNNVVIAWMPLPEPYTESEDKK